mmetsp:Transcript_18070/g.40072  ORF Transcript_18070/g.40072 Transcript_18070/m.40072 type:complete len:253 (+) Transcript_18070:1090-1848(+)
MAGRADAFPHLLNEIIRNILHVPIGGGAAHAHHEVLQDLLSAHRVRHLWVELQAEEATHRVRDSRMLRVGRMRDLEKALRHARDLVSVGHPHLRLVDTLEDERRGSCVLHGLLDHGAAILPLCGRRHLATEMVGYFLHAVADAQDGDAALLDHLPHRWVDVGRGRVVYGGGAAGQDDTHHIALREDRGINEARKELAEDVQLAHPAGDQVRVLAAEVQDRNLLPRGVQLGGHCVLDAAGVRAHLRQFLCNEI